ncbi:hypothetical protein KAR91_83310 [Candidatus Pacearchaeota archaeon]|nr:hypothetical protein [Candidatus Pacearchaeota archaeon]
MFIFGKKKIKRYEEEMEKAKKIIGEGKQERENFQNEHKVGSSFTCLNISMMIQEVRYNYGCKCMTVEAIYRNDKCEVATILIKEELFMTLIKL